VNFILIIPGFVVELLISMVVIRTIFDKVPFYYYVVF